MQVYFIRFPHTFCSDLHIANAKATKSSKNSTTTKKPKFPNASSRNIDLEGGPGNRLTTPEPAKRLLKKSVPKPPTIQTGDESDELAIKKTKGPRKVDKGKTRVIESPPETFESAGTDVDLENPRPGSSNMKPPSDQVDISEVEEERERKPLPKKRGRPHKGEVEEEPPSKRGKTQKMDGNEVKGSTKSKSKRQAKKVTKMRKEADPSLDTSDIEEEAHLPSETKTPASDTRKPQRRTLDDPSDEKQDEFPDGEELGLNLNRVRLDSIPPEGVVIRKKNGITEILLPPVMYVQFCCICRPTPNFRTVVNPRGRLRVTGERLGVPENEPFPPMF